MRTEDIAKQAAPPYARESESLSFARRVLIATLVMVSVALLLLFVSSASCSLHH